MAAVEHSSRPRNSAPSPSNRRTLAIMAAVLLLLLTVIWSATLWDISRSEKEVQATIEITTRTLARALSEHMMSTVKRLELTARELDDAWTPTGNDIIEEVNRLKKSIGDLAMQISIVEPTGVVRYSTLQRLPGLALLTASTSRCILRRPGMKCILASPCWGAFLANGPYSFQAPLCATTSLWLSRCFRLIQTILPRFSVALA